MKIIHGKLFKFSTRNKRLLNPITFTKPFYNNTMKTDNFTTAQYI